MKKPVTLSKIAAACGGISTSTISLALRNSPKIAQATRERIQKTAQELGYSPNRSLSRTMSEIRTGTQQHYKETLGYITTHPDRFETHIYNGVLQRAQEMGYNIDRFVVGESSKEHERLQRNLIARGIRGLIFAPFKQANSTFYLDWQNFAGVSIGYTLANPELTRVTRDLDHYARQTFERLEQRGYKRLGFAMEKSHEERMDHANLAGFLSHQWLQPDSANLPSPLVRDRLDQSHFVDWFNQYKPDCIVTMHHLVSEWLSEITGKAKHKVGLFLLNALTAESKTSGIYPNYELMGARATELTASLVERGEFGLPKSAGTLMVKGLWIEGSQIRRKRK